MASAVRSASPIALGELVGELVDPEILALQLRLFGQWLEAGGQWAFDRLIPVQIDGVGQLARAMDTASGRRARCESARWGHAAAGIRNLCESAYGHTALTNGARHLETAGREFHATLQDLIIEIRDRAFAALALNLRAVHATLRKVGVNPALMGARTGWASTRCLQIATQLRTYTDAIANPRLLPLAAALDRHLHTLLKAVTQHEQ